MIAHAIAIRNLLKNRYRTFISVLMISGALVGVTLFRGYVLRTLEVIQTTIVNGQFGHLQIAKPEYWSQEFKNKKDTLLTDYGALVEKVKAIPKGHPHPERLVAAGGDGAGLVDGAVGRLAGEDEEQ